MYFSKKNYVYACNPEKVVTEESTVPSIAMIANVVIRSSKYIHCNFACSLQSMCTSEHERKGILSWILFV
jgi:hypothetical protein